MGHLLLSGQVINQVSKRGQLLLLGQVINQISKWDSFCCRGKLLIRSVNGTAFVVRASY